jgi:hypothetical protein
MDTMRLIRPGGGWRNHDAPDGQAGGREFRGDHAVRWHFHWFLLGVEQLESRRKHQNRLDALPVVGRLVVAHVARRQGIVLGYRQADQ